MSQLFFSFLPTIGDKIEIVETFKASEDFKTVKTVETFKTVENFENIEYDRNVRFLKNCDIHGYTQFKFYSKNRIKCIKCNSKVQSRRKSSNKQKLLDKHGRKCSKCGYNKCDSALQFHHTDPSQKKFKLSYSAPSVEKLDLEAKKCILLCANCHAEIEHDILQKKLEQFYSKKESKEFSLS